VVFSSVDGSGSSEICLRAAEVLAAVVPASLCLVSASLPAFYHGSQKGHEWRGLTSAMTSSEPITKFILRTTFKNLWFMPVRSDDVARPYLFPSDQLRSRMIELKKQFNYILIDAPPVTSSPNAVVLGQLADGVILVIEANSTRYESARLAKETFDEAKVNLLGAILTNDTSGNLEGKR
jgi:Mrp family chromosome partitioning ATPase